MKKLAFINLDCVTWCYLSFIFTIHPFCYWIFVYYLFTQLHCAWGRISKWYLFTIESHAIHSYLCVIDKGPVKALINNSKLNISIIAGYCMDFCMYPRYEVLQLCRIQVIIVAGCSTKFCNTIFQPKYADKMIKSCKPHLKTWMIIVNIFCQILSMHAFMLFWILLRPIKSFYDAPTEHINIQTIDQR